MIISISQALGNNGILHADFANVKFHTLVDVSERTWGVLGRLSISLRLSAVGCTQARTSSWDSKDYVQENVARGQTRNVITSSNDRYIAAIVE